MYRTGNLIGLILSAGALTGLASLSVTPGGEGLLAPGEFQIPELCWSKLTTGSECPTCHLGRSLVLALHGRFSESLDQHPGGVWLAGWLALHTLARGVLTFLRPPEKKWLLDLGATTGSLFFCFLVVLGLSL